MDVELDVKEEVASVFAESDEALTVCVVSQVFLVTSTSLGTPFIPIQLEYLG
jgi:hypothetical protein